MKFLFLSLVLVTNVFAQTLESASQRINDDLPEVYDSVTKLIKTTVENNDVKFHFIVNANQKEYNWAMPKVKSQVLKRICSDQREGRLLRINKANVVYSYENGKGQSLGEFMIRPEHCLKK